MIKITRHIDIDTLNLAKFWLEYIPDWWHLEDLLSKEARELSENELNILLRTKLDKRMLDDIERFKDMAVTSNGEISLSEEDSKRLDNIQAYLENNEGFAKISREEHDYVAMIYNASEFQDTKGNGIYESLAQPYLEAYSNAVMPTLYGKTGRKTSGVARAKKPHSVYPRIPNRIK